MAIELQGRAWRFGDNIDTDTLAPGLYMKSSLDTLASHCLEAVDPGFATEVKPGDIIIAGRNFGIGSSREQAAQVLKHLGVSAVIAQSFGGIFYRNALNLGLIVLECADSDKISANDELSVDPAAGIIINRSRNQRLSCQPLPQHLLAMVRAGGLMAHLEHTLKP